MLAFKQMEFIRSFLLRLSDCCAMCRKGRTLFLLIPLFQIAAPCGSWARVGVDYQMQLGNPSAATVDATNHEHYLIQKVRYALDYNDTTHQANWVSWSYTTADTGSTKRQDSFRADTSLPIGFCKSGVRLSILDMTGGTCVPPGIAPHLLPITMKPFS